MNRREAMAALVALPAAARVAVVADLKPTDVIVLEHPGTISPEQAARLQALMRDIWPHRRCVVITDGMRLKVAPGDAV